MVTLEFFYAVKEMMAGGTIWKYRFQFGQLTGLSGSSGPLQSRGFVVVTISGLGSVVDVRPGTFSGFMTSAIGFGCRSRQIELRIFHVRDPCSRGKGWRFLLNYSCIAI